MREDITSPYPKNGKYLTTVERKYPTVIIQHPHMHQLVSSISVPIKLKCFCVNERV